MPESVRTVKVSVEYDFTFRIFDPLIVLYLDLTISFDAISKDYRSPFDEPQTIRGFILLCIGI